MIPKFSSIPTAHDGVLHQLSSRLVAFEHRPPGQQYRRKGSEPHNTLLFLGGLNDGLLTVRYPSLLAKMVPKTWRVVEVLLSSCYTGWTTSDLARDATELEVAVAYFRSKNTRNKVILLGHSTGSQVMMEYAVGPWSMGSTVPNATYRRPKIDGIVLQAGVSDREGAENLLSPSELRAATDIARKWIEQGRGSDILPSSATKNILGCSPSAKRWLSLIIPMGDDDYFSSDLSDSTLQRTFGELGRRAIPLLILLSENDEHMPQRVDKEMLIDRWKRFVEASGGVMHASSGVIKGATHNLNKSAVDVAVDLCGRVLNFLDYLEQNGHESAKHQQQKL